jgi:hypothetical protein
MDTDRARNDPEGIENLQAWKAEKIVVAGRGSAL